MKKNLLLLSVIVFFINCSTLRAQTSSVHITGSPCAGDKLTAHFSGGTLSKLKWQRFGKTVLTSSLVTDTIITVAGGHNAGNNSNQLHFPYSVHFDANGNMYVSDHYNNRIQKWTPGATDGITVAGGAGAGNAANQLNKPFGIFIDAHSNIYIADQNNDRVQKWEPGALSGVTVAGGNGKGSSADRLDAPNDVYVDAAGNIYVADGSNHRVQKWARGATSGTTVAGGNGAGAAANQINLPYGLWVDKDGNIYVADRVNHRVQKWEPGATSGTIVAGGNGVGTGANQLYSPDEIYIDADGNLYIADTDNQRIQKWAKGATSGITVAGGAFGSGANQVKWPYGICVDDYGNIYVADKENNRVQKYFAGDTGIIKTSYIPTAPGSYTVIATSSTGSVDTSAAIIVADVKVDKITGQKRGLCGGGTFSYKSSPFHPESVTDVMYTWTAPSGSTILSGQGTDHINLNFSPGFVEGVISLQANSATCGAGNMVTHILSVKPNKPSKISGPFSVNAGQTGVAYSVRDTDDVVYNWEVPPGAAIVSGQGTGNITVNWGSTPGKIVVKALQCNDSARQQMYVQVIQPTQTIHADATWKSSNVLYTDWEKSTFNDAPWDHAISPSPGGCSTYKFSMWGPKGKPIVYLRKQFYIAGEIKDINYRQFGVDDDADIYINDTLVLQEANCTASDENLKTILLSHLRHGNNLIAIKAHDCGGGCYTVAIDFDIVLATGTGKSITVAITNNSLQQHSVNNISVYPNPAANTVNVLFTAAKAAKYSIQLTDITGKVLYTANAVSNTGKNSIMLNVSRYAKGTYIIGLVDETGQHTIKLSKQ